MSMNGILEWMQSFNFNSELASLEQGGRALMQTELIVLAVLAAAGLLWCLFGLKIVRVWAGILGLGTGLAGGTAAAYFLGLDVNYIWIPGVALGIILAVLGAWLYRFGAFLTVWLTVSAACVYLFKPPTWMFALICFGAGLVIALLSVKFLEIVTILATTVFGAMLSGTCIYFLIPIRSGMIHIILSVVIGVAGLLVQLLLESKRRKRQSLKKAEEIRKTHSTANEVEKARALVESLDEESAETDENIADLEEDIEQEKDGEDPDADEGDEDLDEDPDADEVLDEDLDDDIEILEFDNEEDDDEKN